MVTVRTRRGFVGLVETIVSAKEEAARNEQQRENLFAATTLRSSNLQGYGGSMPDPGMMAPMGIPLGDAVAESLRYALELSTRIESPEEGAVRPDDQLRKDYLTFLGYLHNPKQADPVQQVAMVNATLRMNLSTQMFFQLRNECSLDPEFPNRVPESVKYYVQDEKAGGSGPINSGLSMTRFLVNTFRELGHCYISFGGVSPQEIQRLSEYIIMLNNYLREHRLFHTMDPYRKGQAGSPYYGLPVRQAADDMEDPLSHGIDMPGAGGIDMPSKGIDMPSKGIDMPGSGADLSKGIDFPGGSDLSKGIDMPKTSGNVRQGIGTPEDPGEGERESLSDGDGRGSFSLADRDGFSLGGRDDAGLGGGGLHLGDRDDFYLR